MASHWVWIEPAVIVAIHEEQLAEHGGPAGMRDQGLPESALARPRQLAHYGKLDAADLAASHAFGIARNHPFIDGNKRTAFVAAELFLALNCFRLAAEDADCVTHMLALAGGELEETRFDAWLRQHLQPR